MWLYRTFLGLWWADSCSVLEVHSRVSRRGSRPAGGLDPVVRFNVSGLRRVGVSGSFFLVVAGTV
jgi:hypothetical protein